MAKEFKYIEWSLYNYDFIKFRNSILPELEEGDVIICPNDDAKRIASVLSQKYAALFISENERNVEEYATSIYGILKKIVKNKIKFLDVIEDPDMYRGEIVVSIENALISGDIPLPQNVEILKYKKEDDLYGSQKY